MYSSVHVLGVVQSISTGFPVEYLVSYMGRGNPVTCTVKSEVNHNLQVGDNVLIVGELIDGCVLIHKDFGDIKVIGGVSENLSSELRSDSPCEKDMSSQPVSSSSSSTSSTSLPPMVGGRSAFGPRRLPGRVPGPPQQKAVETKMDTVLSTSLPPEREPQQTVPSSSNFVSPGFAKKRKPPNVAPISYEMDNLPPNNFADTLPQDVQEDEIPW